MGSKKERITSARQGRGSLHTLTQTERERARGEETEGQRSFATQSSLVTSGGHKYEEQFECECITESPGSQSLLQHD